MTANVLAQFNLVLFFSGGISLKKWNDSGILDREIALYRRLRPQFNQITFVTYGDAGDSRFRDQIGDINLVLNKWRLPQRVYERSLAVSHPKIWRGDTILKTNQIVGAETALRAARLFNKRLVVRCGYLLSLNTERQFGRDSKEAREARRIESKVLPAADRIVVTTAEISDAICDRYQIPQQRIAVIPNYVDTSLFSPGMESDSARHGLIFIGRFTEPKNVFSLLEAVDGLDLKLTLVGAGALEDQLRKFALDRDISARFIGIVPHGQLPELLRKSSVYILPSHYEGHPKTLLEAMACGVPVIGANSPGIREVIDDGETGLLCEPSPEGIRQAIISLLSDEALRERIGRNARQYAVEHFSLERIVELELDLYRSMAS